MTSHLKESKVKIILWLNYIFKTLFQINYPSLLQFPVNIFMFDFFLVLRTTTYDELKVNIVADLLLSVYFGPEIYLSACVLPVLQIHKHLLNFLPPASEG